MSIENTRDQLREARAAAPVIFGTAGPACVAGACGEAHPCGKPYSGMEELLS